MTAKRAGGYANAKLEEPIFAKQRRLSSSEDDAEGAVAKGKGRIMFETMTPDCESREERTSAPNLSSTYNIDNCL